jgi:hypothetical protein
VTNPVLQPGTEQLTGLGEEIVLPRIEQADCLALGNKDAEAAQRRHQSRHRHLPLMILGEQETPQFRPEMPIDAGWKRGRQHSTVWRLPALTAKIDDMRSDQEILHHEARVAHEARAGWRLSPDGPLLVDRELLLRAATPTMSVAGRLVRLRLGRLVHAARFDVRPTRTSFEAGDFVGLRGNYSPQLRHLLKQRDHQVFELGVR